MRLAWARRAAAAAAGHVDAALAAGARRASSLAAASKPVKLRRLACIQFNEQGRFRETEYLKSQFGVPTRDLRSVDVRFRNQPPTIVVRRNALLVNMAHIKALIRHDAVLVFDPAHPLVQSFRNKLSLALQETGGEDTRPPRPDAGVAEAEPEYMPTEFVALEAILVDVCDNLRRQVQTLSPATSEVLEALSSTEGSMQSLERLLPLSKSLSLLDASVKQCREAIETVLESDQDMADMYLTVRFEQSAIKRTSDQHEEIEMIFETYLRQLEEIEMEIRQLQRAITSTQDFIELNLDLVRNRIMRLDLMLNLGTFSMACAGLVAGIFGMNLLSHLEENPAAFYVVSGSVFGAAAAIFSTGFAYCRRRRIL